MTKIQDNAKQHCATLVATFDKEANHVLITHKRKYDVSATYECALNIGELDGGDQHILTPLEISWLKSIDGWISDCYQSVGSL